MSTARFSIMRGILGVDSDMPRKYQSGKLQIRKDVNRPYYFIRATVAGGYDKDGRPKPRRPEHRLGFLDEISKDEAKRMRADLLESINAHRFVAQSQMRFKDLSRGPARITAGREALNQKRSGAQVTRWHGEGGAVNE